MEVVEIDRANDAVLGTHPVEGCRYHHGMALDSAHHRPFLCNGTKMPAVCSGLPQGNRPPSAASWSRRSGVSSWLGSHLRRVFRFIAVSHQDDAEHYRKLEDFPVQKMVHSLVVDTVTHRVYAPEEQENGQRLRMVVYDDNLILYGSFRKLRPPEEHEHA